MRFVDLNELTNIAVSEEGNQMKINVEIPEDAKWVYLDFAKGEMFGVTVKGNYIKNIIETTEEK